ncbi:MAG: phosphoglycerate dehydrogenase [Phaeospirillum sp.]|nr:phosphoglycerate dehydrogenase [Phaeospirillum sp.]
MKVAVASRSFSRHPVLRAELQALHPDATFNDAGVSLAGDGLVAFLRGHDAAITALERLDEALFTALPDLRIIGKYGVGLDMLDLETMRRRGIRLGWTGGVNRRSVSELVIAMAISLLRHVPRGNREVCSGAWRQLMGRHLSGRTVGIIGCGHIGQDLAPLLRAFGCAVLAHDVRDFPDFYAAHGVEALPLDELLRRADVVTLHLPLDATTRNILSAPRLALMRPDAILINCARGGLVDEAAVKDMLMSGRLAAAGFDVLDREPPEDRELLNLPNMLVTPHIGGSAEEAVLAMGRAAIAGLSRNAVPEPGSEVWRSAGLG